MMNEPLRVLIVDDSALMRNLLRTMLTSDPGIVVVGEAVDGREALAKVAELRPDLVTLDVRMPVMDGVETTRQIMAYHPTPILVLTASLSSHNVDITFQMLGAGALDVMEKPQLHDSAAWARAHAALVRKIKLLARVKVVTHLRGRRNAAAGVPASISDSSASSRKARPVGPAFPVVVIGASTGGPGVVRQILAGLPRDYGAAVLIVQHIAQGFSAGMVDWLAGSSALPVALAEPGTVLAPGHAVVAPERYDLLLEPGGPMRLSGQQLLMQRPAIDITMQSAAEVYGSAAIGVLLTGMGRDGARGLLSIRRAGGYTIAQDEASCTIYGMPRAAVELGAATAVLPPDKIIAALRQRVVAKA